MANDMIKKSVDITKKDNKWLQEHDYINFSQFVRRKVAERRAENIKPWKKKKLYKDIDSIAEKGQELRKQLKEEKHSLMNEYDCEVSKNELDFFLIEYEGEEYTAHWEPKYALEKCYKEVPDPVREFGNKFVESVRKQDEKLRQFVAEHTYFDINELDEATMEFNGQGHLQEFTLYTSYLPTKPDSFSIKFDKKVVLDIRDIKKEVKD